MACRHSLPKPLPLAVVLCAVCRAVRPRAGNILDTWFGRSVIRSCAKLSYPMVQVGVDVVGGGVAQAVRVAG